MKVCTYVCMCVCPAACRQTHTSHHPKIWRGLLISPGLGTEPGGDPKCRPPGGTSHTDPIWKTLKGKELDGASKQKLLLEVGLYSKILFTGGSHWPWARRVHTTKWGCMLWELGGGQQTKVTPRGGFVYTNFICGGLTPTQSPQGPLINLHRTFSQWNCEIVPGSAGGPS
jgi:hypothetical protein